MDPRLRIIRPIAAASLLALAGCGRDSSALSSETDDSSYREGQQLDREGRSDEALNAYLKAIARRGDAAPESHLDAGIIYLTHIKDPIAAIYHFRKFVELEPNSKQAALVLGMIEAAKREFARTLPGQPLDSQSERMGYVDQINSLQHENEELKAELSALRAGVSASSVIRTPAGGTPITFPSIVPRSEEPPPILREVPANEAAAPAPAAAPADASASPLRPAPAAPVQAEAQARAPAGARRHLVVAGESLFSIAKKYYGTGSKWRDILAANRDLLSSEKSVKAGMTLKIP